MTKMIHLHHWNHKSEWHCQDRNLFIKTFADHCFLFSLKGFEPRGTAIGQRLVTWNNMVKNTGYKATLANYPFKYADEQAKK